MAVGVPPFSSPNLYALHQKILNDDAKIPRYVSSELRSLVTGFLQRDAEQRLGGGATDVSKHPFFEGMDWEAVLGKKESGFKPHSNEDYAMGTNHVFTKESLDYSYITPVDSLISGISISDTSVGS